LLDKFEVIVEDGVGFELYESVERTKRALSDQERAELVLRYPGAELQREVQRSEFTTAAQRPTQRIVEALDQVLTMGGVRGEEVEIACLTGGTSRVPLVREALTARLPNAHQRTLRSFHSVVQGLARHASHGA
jgi:hypothetical chaperone protein